MLQRIAIDDLTPGMYVNRVLDETGKVKVRSKGVVRSDTVITQLRSKGVEFVEIDTDKGKATVAAPSSSNAAEAASEAPPVSDVKHQISSESLTCDGLKAAEQLFQKAMAIQQSFLNQ